MSAVNGDADCCAADGSWTGGAVVKLRDGDGNSVSGATVTGQWSGVYSGGASGVSNPGGNATFETPVIQGAGSLTFTVLSVSHPTLTYDSGMNGANSVTIPSPV